MNPVQSRQPSIVELVKLPTAELKSRLDALPGGDGRLEQMMQAEINARRGLTQGQIDFEYECGLLRQIGVYSPGSSW